MSRRVRHHVNPLGVEFFGRRIDPLALPPGEVEVELGCADARFLFERAPHHPRTTFVGLEIREPLVDEVNEKARELGLANLRAVFTNVNADLDSLFADRRVARFFVNFPDPWFKRRHHKRRVMNAELVEVLHKKLEPNGELFFQSDVWDLALDALAVLEGAPQLFRNLDGPWSFCRDNPFGAKSLREVRCEARQMRIWRMRYVRV
jgi:tRNA (guanine-N7-)-methyltransferase